MNKISVNCAIQLFKQEIAQRPFSLYKFLSADIFTVNTVRPQDEITI
jgi:hypothetical protein